MGGTSPPTVAREAGTSRQTGRRVRRRPSASHVAIGLAVIVAFALNYLALQDRGETHMVAVADHPLAAGSALTFEDLRFVPVESSFAGLGSMIREQAAGDFEGWIVRSSLDEGELVTSTLLVEAGSRPGSRSMSIPVPREHAAGGSLASGDRIDVISVVDGQAVFVVVDVEVLSVADSDQGSIGALGDHFLVVAVDGVEALALAEAIDSGSMEVVRSTGAPAMPGGLGIDS